MAVSAEGRHRSPHLHELRRSTRHRRHIGPPAASAEASKAPWVQKQRAVAKAKKTSRTMTTEELERMASRR